MRSLGELLEDWERWAADLMESQPSYPVLCFFQLAARQTNRARSLTTISTPARS